MAATWFRLRRKRSTRASLLLARFLPLREHVVEDGRQVVATGLLAGILPACRRHLLLAARGQRHHVEVLPRHGAANDGHEARHAGVVGRRGVARRLNA